jgi:hypothetical protein
LAGKGKPGESRTRAEETSNLSRAFHDKATGVAAEEAATATRTDRKDADMPIFAIETALTCISHERRGGREAATRILEVQGRAPGGACNRARFVFSPDIEPGHPTPVGYLTRAAEAGLSLIGWLPAAEFEAHRRIIDEGGPLQVHYETRDGREGYLRRLALGRADAALRAVATTQPARGGARAAFAMPL